MACGGDSPSTTSQAAQQQPGNGGRGFLQDPKVRACLQKQGVTLPALRRPPNGQPPSGQPPNGQPPNGQRPNRDSAQIEKLRKALRKCGVTLGNGNGAPPVPEQGTTTSSAS